MGRPSTFTDELAAALCERLAEGESLRAICRDSGMPAKSTVLRWVADDETFRDRYAQARAVGFDAVADEVMEIADEEPSTLTNGATDAGDVAHKRLRFDARRWYLSKLAPAKYGDKTAMELTGANGGPVQISETERAAKVASLLAVAQSRRATDASDLV